MTVCEPEEAAAVCDHAVLPVRPVIDGCLFAPFSTHKISISELGDILGDISVFTGSADMIRQYCRGKIYDYSKREDFCVYNAALTAEGAIEIALRETDSSLLDSRILVTGYGRIGKALVVRLSAFGAEITIAVRSAEAEARAKVDGYSTVSYPIPGIAGFDLIFNTVPARVISSREIDMIDEHALIIDLASAPGGVDRDRAAERGVRCIRALALPGKTAPVSAGRIICNTVISMIKEENGG